MCEQSSIAYLGNNDIDQTFTENVEYIACNSYSLESFYTYCEKKDCLLILDFLSFPSELFVNKKINVPISLYIKSDLFHEMEELYIDFINKYLNKFDTLICSEEIKKTLENAINCKLHYYLIENDINLSKAVMELSSSPFSKKIKQKKNIYNTNVSVLANILKNHVLPFSSRDLVIHQNDKSEFDNLNELLAESNYRSFNQSEKIDIAIFDFQNLFLNNLEEQFIDVFKNIVSGGFVVIVEDFIPQLIGLKGHSITELERWVVKATKGKVALEHFELLEYQKRNSEIGTGVLVLRKLGI